MLKTTPSTPPPTLNIGHNLMRVLITIAYVFILQTSFGQSYLGYYAQINEAKRLALDSNYQQAALVYKQTFEEYDFEFARDCINAMEISSFAHQDSLTFYFVKCALKRGVPITYFKQSSKLQSFRSTPYWHALVKEAPTLRSEYNASISIEIRDEINAMFKADQQIRARYYQWSNYLFRPMIGKKWRELNQQQVLRLIEITQQNGFPGEWLIGIDSPEDHKKISSNQFSAGIPIVVFVHHYSQPNVSFDSILVEEVFKGYLNNEHFATICDFEAEFGKNKFDCLGYFGFRHTPKNYTHGEFDEKRKQVGLLLDAEIQRLNQIQLLTKFWNRLK